CLVVTNPIERRMPDPDTTADFPPRLSHAEVKPTSGSPAPNQRFAAGSAPALADETRDMLQSRLRAAATMLTVGFTVFLVRDVFVPHMLGGLIYPPPLVLLLLIS